MNDLIVIPVDMNDISAYRYAMFIQIIFYRLQSTNKMSVYKYTSLNYLSINNTHQRKYLYIKRKLSYQISIGNYHIKYLYIDRQLSYQISIYR
jgi:hypothetical protein